MTDKFDWGIRARWALPMQGSVRVEEDYFIGVLKNRITFAGPFKKSLQSKSKKFINASGKVLMPGLVNGHTHLAMTLFRGIEDDVPLKTWLFARIFPLEKKFVEPGFVKLGTELAALECIRFGTTTIADMYFYPQTSIDVWIKAGLRGVFGQTMMSFPMPEDIKLGPGHLSRFENLFRKYKDHPQIAIALAPHAPYTCDDQLLTAVANLAKDLNARLHIHLDESPHEGPESLKKTGKSPTQHLFDLGFLTPRTFCAHSVHLSASDRALLKKSGAGVVHNPDSNAKLGSGAAPIAEYLKEGIPVGLGTDGSASNNDLSLFGAMDLATKIQKLIHGDSMAMTAAQALWMATQGGAQVLGLGDQVGSLEVGKKADFILVDFQFPHLQPVSDPISHLVYATQGLEVDTVFCEGKPLLRDKKFVGLKPEPIFARVEKMRKKIAAFVEELKIDSPTV